MKVARSHFQMKQLCAITHPDNKASTRLLESLGFDYIRRLDLEGVDGESLYFEADI
jgi:RimJ/RimL family protein N-acetyltransferase